MNQEYLFFVSHYFLRYTCKGVSAPIREEVPNKRELMESMTQWEEKLENRPRDEKWLTSLMAILARAVYASSPRRRKRERGMGKLLSIARNALTDNLLTAQGPMQTLYIRLALATETESLSEVTDVILKAQELITECLEDTSFSYALGTETSFEHKLWPLYSGGMDLLALATEWLVVNWKNDKRGADALNSLQKTLDQANKLDVFFESEKFETRLFNMRRRSS